MKIISVEPVRYSLPFNKPFYFGNNTINAKEGYLLTISNGEYSGVGEISVLQEFGTPSAEELKELLPAITEFLLMKDSLEVFSGIAETNIPFPPVVLAGIEQAVLSLLQSSHNTTIDKLMNKRYSSVIKVNGVVSAVSVKDALTAAEKIVGQGYTTIKLKLSGDDDKLNLSKIEAISHILSPEIKIRLDANGTWSLERARLFLKSLDGINIEYIEQPVQNPEDFPLLREDTAIKIAADESVLNEKTAFKIITENLADVLIIKPLLLGGLRRCLSLIELAKQSTIESVITTSLDSSIGRRIAVVLASMIDSPFAHGLSTGSLFGSDTAPDLYSPENGEIHIARLIV